MSRPPSLEPVRDENVIRNDKMKENDNKSTTTNRTTMTKTPAGAIELVAISCSIVIGPR